MSLCNHPNKGVHIYAARTKSCLPRTSNGISDSLVSFTTHLFLIPSLQICCMLAYASALTIYRHAINHMCAFRRGSRTRVRRADGSLSFSLLVILHCNHFVCASTWPFVVRSSPDGFRCGAVLCCRFPFLWLIAQTDCDCELCLLVRLIVVVFVFYFILYSYST